MDQAEVLSEFRAAGALLEGHFILTSGRRSPIYMQCARVLMDPERAKRLIAGLAEQIRKYEPIDTIVAPAMGGIVVGYELARQTGCRSLFVERVDGEFQLRRGFELSRGERVLIAEDVITTGLSTSECVRLCRQSGAVVITAACLIDRSGGKAQLDIPLLALASLDLPTYSPSEVPPELAAVPPTKPGSRALTAG